MWSHVMHVCLKIKLYALLEFNILKETKDYFFTFYFYLHMNSYI